MFLGVSKSMVVRLGWTSFGYAAVQFIRLLNNVVLERILAPSIFGLMAVVNSVRTGIELLSDVGVLQNIISNPNGDDPTFYDTAWTLQAIRGLVLAVLCIFLAGPLARFFNMPQLAAILPVASLFFVFTGFSSVGHALAQKQLQVARVSLFEIGVTLLAFVSQVVLALITPTVWALVIGLVIAGAATMTASYLYLPGLRHRIMIHAESARQLMRFGRWIFVSTLVYFFAMNFDRLYFAKQITLSELGVYGIARSLCDVITLFVQRASGTVLYPTVAAAGLAPLELRQRLLRGRRTLLLGAALGVGGFFAFSEFIVHLLYDPRYAEAAWIVPILTVGVWFAILTATNDAILMGLAKPAYPALSNAAKLLTYLVGVPIAFLLGGFTAAVVAISVGELVKYIALWALSHRQHLHFGRDDLVLTLAFVGSAFAAGELTRWLGIGHGVEGLMGHVLAASGH
jgi:O-antigen/teichoic acid export membrane protein